MMPTRRGEIAIFGSSPPPLKGNADRFDGVILDPLRLSQRGLVGTVPSELRGTGSHFWVWFFFLGFISDAFKPSVPGKFRMGGIFIAVNEESRPVFRPGLNLRNFPLLRSFRRH